MTDLCTVCRRFSLSIQNAYRSLIPFFWCCCCWTLYKLSFVALYANFIINSFNHATGWTACLSIFILLLLVILLYCRLPKFCQLPRSVFDIINWFALMMWQNESYHPSILFAIITFVIQTGIPFELVSNHRNYKRFKCFPSAIHNWQRDETSFGIWKWHRQLSISPSYDVWSRRTIPIICVYSFYMAQNCQNQLIIALISFARIELDHCRCVCVCVRRRHFVYSEHKQFIELIVGSWSTVVMVIL